MNFGMIKLKYGRRAKFCYSDTDSYILHIITEEFFEDIAADVERWFDTMMKMIKDLFQ